jgi:hypothetical protein
VEIAIARAHATRLLEIRAEAAHLLPRLWALQEEARGLAAAMLPPNLLAGDRRRYPFASAPPGESLVCDPATRGGLTRALLGLARAEPVGAPFLAQLQKTGCVFACGTNGCFRFA